jgi:hypothetical protein
MSYKSILLADSASMNILLLILVGALITSFLIVGILLIKTIKLYILFWYFGTGLIYFLLLLFAYLIRYDSGGGIPDPFVEYVINSLIVLMIWPVVLIILPVGFYLTGSEGSSTPLEMQKFLLFTFIEFIPQLCSLLIIVIINAKGFFQRKKGVRDYKDQNGHEPIRQIQ